MPIKTLSTSRRATVTALLTSALVLAAAGCARTPSGVSTSTNGVLLISMTVSGNINPNDFYFVLFNPIPASQVNSTTGPIPVIADNPWGNGFATGPFTTFMEISPALGQGTGYGMFGVPNTNQLPPFTQLAAPIQSTPIVFSGSGASPSTSIQFEIPISEIQGSSDAADLQINFISTDRLPASGTGGSKNIDALGNTAGGDLNEFLTIPLGISASYTDTGAGSTGNGAIEPIDDVATVGPAGLDGPYTSTSPSDPSADLDISNYSIQVITQ